MTYFDFLALCGEYLVDPILLMEDEVHEPLLLLIKDKAPEHVIREYLDNNL